MFENAKHYNEVGSQVHQVSTWMKKFIEILHCAVLYSTLLYSTLLYSTLLYSTLLYSTLLYSTLLYSTLLYSTLLYSTLLYSTLLYSAVLCCTLLYPTVPFAPHRTVLYHSYMKQKYLVIFFLRMPWLWIKSSKRNANLLVDHRLVCSF